ncbi:MAG: thioredoxin domain-containing protein, partial [Acidobacteriota bacterium]
MKKIPILLIVLLLTIGGKLYSQGIKFNPINFEEALALAEKENKLIFIDFYTDWCAPCKGMEKNVFPDVKVGELYNKEFINLKLNGDKEGRPTVKRYGITSYPTSLFVNNKGEVVFKKVGAQNIESIIKMGKDVIASVNNIYSLIKLKELFPQKQNDEEFLKIYFTKMIEYGESPTEGIEAWLKVQTTIKEDDVDMMEFLIKHMSYLIVDGKAEEIYETNFDEYWDIATRMEEVKLKNMRLAMINNTMKMAYDQQNPELMRA